jgi:hypothetical protein
MLFSEAYFSKGRSGNNQQQYLNTKGNFACRTSIAQ